MAAESSCVDNFDVFINFRGADTRQGFVKILYEGLVAEGMRVFLDDEELNYGKRLDEELPQAINNSKIYITVISETYASSKWCLRELAEIVRNKQEFKDKKEILPVFYKIKTDDVKLKTDLFKEQLSGLINKNVTAETVEGWGITLKGIADLKAWKVSKEFAEFTKIHKMEAMENEHALELFSWHAFGEPMPPTDSVGETMVLQLTELDISRCERLKKLGGFISKQKKLEVLRADLTRKMVGIPTEIEELTCLREMSFSFSSIYGLPSLFKLTRLEKLSLEACHHLQQLPAELPTSLVELRVSSTSLQSIPDYSYLIHLTKLEFSIGGPLDPLEELQELNLGWVWRLSKLKSLSLYCCSSSFITTIQSEEPSVNLLSQLEKLTLRCSILGTCVLPSCLSALTRLEISLYCGTKALSLPRMNCLTRFNLSNCNNLEHILGLGELESLVSLEIIACTLERLEDISKLSQLQTLRINCCHKLRVIPGVPGLRSLKKLDIERCESLESLVGPSDSESCLYDILRVIERLRIYRCPLLENKLPDDLRSGGTN